MDRFCDQQMNMTNPNQFLNCITVNELKTLTTAKNPSKKLFILETTNKKPINSKESFFDAAYHSLPLSRPPFSLPPPPGTRLVWDALADDMHYCFHNLNCNEADIVWTFANDSTASSMLFMAKAIKIIKQISDGLSSYTWDDSGKVYSVKLRLFLVCSNERSKKELQKDFWFLNQNQ